MPPIRAITLALLVLGASVGAVVLATGSPPGTDRPAPEPSTGLQSFESAEAFATYVERANREYGAQSRFVGFDGGVAVAETTAVNMAAPLEDSTKLQTTEQRYATTNVQEIGIDEPDLVKMDGETAYFSPFGQYYHAPNEAPKGVHVLSTEPAGNVSHLGTISDSGRLLRVNDTIVVLGDDAVVGYDVSDPAKPEQVWYRALDGQVRGARLLDGEIYLVVAQGVDRGPCPVEPLSGVTTPCAEVLHPPQVVPTEATYTIAKLDATTGEPDGTKTVVGSRDSVVYMSEESLYLTLTKPTPRGELLIDFLLTEARDELPERSIDRLEEVRGYTLSDRARYYEAQHVLESWLSTMDEADRREVQERLDDAYTDYTRDRLRELTTTQIIEVGTADLSVQATGEVPGSPLNQWALDEHNGTLRIATTVSAPRTRWSPANTSNDVYTLDSDLDVQGSVTGMSDGQRVFGVRFVGDTGYVITFRQVDPLHVIDLADPENPEELGQLKLPGFSRYLHPLGEDRLLGVGEEDGKVKTVIFDVSDPTDPAIEHSRVLGLSWSAAVDNHHAFLYDDRHEAFYIPSRYGGRVLSANDLSTLDEPTVTEPKRARYVGDYLYVFGEREVQVIDERSWETVDSLRL